MPLPEKYIFHFMEPNQFELSRKDALRLFSKEEIERDAIPVWDSRDFPPDDEDENLLLHIKKDLQNSDSWDPLQARIRFKDIIKLIILLIKEKIISLIIKIY